MDKEYASLLSTYKRMFSLVDAFHFNSQNTANVYKKYLTVPDASAVIPITHSGIKDCRRRRVFDTNLLKIGFIGSEAPFKGLPLLKEVLASLNTEGYEKNIMLYVYGGRTGKDDVLENVYYKGKFSAAEMETVFNGLDLLIVPSICNETFSLVTLEALSFGTIVLVSSKVGAKDVVRKYAPEFVFDSKTDLYNLLKTLVNDRSLMYKYQDNLNDDQWNYSIDTHAKDIVNNLYF